MNHIETKLREVAMLNLLKKQIHRLAIYVAGLPWADDKYSADNRLGINQSHGEYDSHRKDSDGTLPAEFPRGAYIDSFHDERTTFGFRFSDQFDASFPQGTNIDGSPLSGLPYGVVDVNH